MIRTLVRRHRDISLVEASVLLRSPRTMLRYAIERFPEEERKAYLRGTVD